jgi:peptidoglycan L-alanyl-D-glutamate endopeptidase CwlK
MAQAKKEFTLSERSNNALKGVDKRLQDVVALAIKYATEDFFVNEGLRSKERQALLVKQGASKTMNSKHITGHAVDLIPVAVKGVIPWNDTKKFDAIGKAMMKAAAELGVKIRWGKDWNGNGIADEKFVDSPHFELLDTSSFVKGF